jgi:hypothetical protein
MNMTWSLESRTLVKANKSWRSALRGACERIRNAHDCEMRPAPAPHTSNAEILGAAQRVREEFKFVNEGNAHMLRALADFKNRRSKLRCEHALIGKSGLAPVPRA